MTTAFSSLADWTVTSARANPLDPDPRGGPAGVAAAEPEPRLGLASGAVSAWPAALSPARPLRPVRRLRVTGLVAVSSPPIRPRTMSTTASASALRRRTTRVTGDAPPGWSSAATTLRAWLISWGDPRTSTVLLRSSAETRGPPASSPNSCRMASATSSADGVPQAEALEGFAAAAVERLGDLLDAPHVVGVVGDDDGVRIGHGLERPERGHQRPQGPGRLVRRQVAQPDQAGDDLLAGAAPVEAPFWITVACGTIRQTAPLRTAAKP